MADNSVSRMPQILPLTAHQAQARPTQNPEAPYKVRCNQFFG
jgi:hypothetical protein